MWERERGRYLQLPMMSGHDCRSMGKFFNSMGQVALIVRLQRERESGNERDSESEIERPYRIE